MNTASVACAHKRYRRGKDVPRRWGSYRTRLCLDCGAYQTHSHIAPPLPDTPWKPSDGYEADTTRSDDE